MNSIVWLAIQVPFKYTGTRQPRCPRTISAVQLRDFAIFGSSQPNAIIDAETDKPWCDEANRAEMGAGLRRGPGTVKILSQIDSTILGPVSHGLGWNSSMRPPAHLQVFYNSIVVQLDDLVTSMRCMARDLPGVPSKTHLHTPSARKPNSSRPRNPNSINRIVNRWLQNIILLVKSHWIILKVTVTDYVRVCNDDAVTFLQHLPCLTLIIDNQLALYAHRKLPSFTPINLWTHRMEQVISSGNSNSNINRRSSPYTGHNIAIAVNTIISVTLDLIKCQSKL